MPPIIKVENISKKYIISHNAPRGAQRFSEVLMSPFHRKKTEMVAKEEFWALKDINFEVEQGDRVGIIGRNGAGKSTLLKVLSKITTPTTGKISINGRVASLLEVGTGFHPELTGRENIYLNGAILGMKRAEIKKKFDEIVDFSGVEKFLDTQVKRYSSGMYVRLAFAVAAHLEPEILVIDEVLAVGDAEFQKKCLGKMNDISKNSGRTILFVSHNMAAVQKLCNKGIFLSEGKIKKKGEVSSIISEYLSQNTVKNAEFFQETNEFFDLINIFLSNNSGEKIKNNTVSADDDAFLNVRINLKKVNPAFNIGYSLYSSEGDLLYWSFSTDSEESTWPMLHVGINQFRTRLPKHFMNEGDYEIHLMASLHFQAYILKENKVVFPISIQGGLSKSPYWYQRRPGLCAPQTYWELL